MIESHAVVDILAAVLERDDVPGVYGSPVFAYEDVVHLHSFEILLPDDGLGVILDALQIEG